VTAARTEIGPGRSILGHRGSIPGGIDVLHRAARGPATAGGERRGPVIPRRSRRRRRCLQIAGKYLARTDAMHARWLR
jgi:hypothetical protein